MTAVGLEEGLLLRAILEPDDAAAWRSFECWRDLRGERGMHMTAWPIIRLLPMVHRRLEVLPHYDGWERNRLRGVHRKSLTKNTILWGRAKDALRRLADAGHDLMLVDGALHGQLHYPDPGARMLVSIDLVVRPGVISKIETLLGADGWHPVMPERTLAGRMAAALSRLVIAPRRVFKTADGLELTVREDLFGAAPVPRAPAPHLDAWTRSTRLELRDLALRQPSPEHQVLMAAYAATSAVPETRLVDPLLDLALLLRVAPIDLDGAGGADRVVALATTGSLVSHLAAALKALASLTTEPDPTTRRLSERVAATPRDASAERLFQVHSALAPGAPEAVLRTLWERFRRRR